LKEATAEGGPSGAKSKLPDPELLPVRVYSDFHEQQERLVLVNPKDHLKSADVFDTVFGTAQVLMTLRGQTWVLPVLDSPDAGSFTGVGQNLPPRRYRVVPGATTGGSIRVLAAKHVPSMKTDDDDVVDPRRLAVVLATDPLSPTAEHAFYLLEVQSDATNAFQQIMQDQHDQQQLKPFLGGGASGSGSTRNGGLGSVLAESVTVSPCGRRMAWTDTDGRICIMTLPVYGTNTTNSQAPPTYAILPRENEMGEPMSGELADLVWSPGGRYIAVRHYAKNQVRSTKVRTVYFIANSTE